VDDAAIVDKFLESNIIGLLLRRYREVSKDKEVIWMLSNIAGGNEM